MWQMVQVAKFDKSNMTRFLESGFVVPLAMFVKKEPTTLAFLMESVTFQFLSFGKVLGFGKHLKQSNSFPSKIARFEFKG